MFSHLRQQEFLEPKDGSPSRLAVKTFAHTWSCADGLQTVMGGV